MNNNEFFKLDTVYTIYCLAPRKTFHWERCYECRANHRDLRDLGQSRKAETKSGKVFKNYLGIFRQENSGHEFERE